MAAPGVALTPARKRLRRRERGLAYLLLIPSLLVFGVFVFWPLVHNVYLGFYRNPPFPGLPSTYVGFDQYKDVLTSETFFDSVKTTFLFAFLTVPTGIVLGLGLAVLAHQKLRGIGIYRTLFSSTVATSVAVAAVVFGTLMNPSVGLLPWLGTVAGDRFEYEMNVLLQAAEKDVPVHEVPIEAIYLEGNESSHFRPVVDWARRCTRPSS